MSTTQQNPNDIFWLARYAHNQCADLFAQAKTVEPSIFWSIEVSFSDTSSVYGGDYLLINAHWKRVNPPMFQRSLWLMDKASVDQFVTKLAADVAVLHPAGVAA